MSARPTLFSARCAGLLSSGRFFALRSSLGTGATRVARCLGLAGCLFGSWAAAQTEPPATPVLTPPGWVPLPAVPPPYVPAAPTSPIPAPVAIDPEARRPTGAQIALATPRIEHWRGGTDRPQVGQVRGRKAPFLILNEDGSPSLLRLRFPAALRGRTLQLHPSRGLAWRVQPTDAGQPHAGEVVVSSTGDVQLWISLEGGPVRGDLTVQIEGVQTHLTFLRATERMLQRIRTDFGLDVPAVASPANPAANAGQ